jgi:hypothetical protein
LIEEFKFPPDYYERMGWVTFLVWQRLAAKKRWERFVQQRNAELQARREGGMRLDG